ncbi:odorant receptor Or1-like [Helicoverpa zea]|uniref:odorant receptor Or1-like n=1 Tax=Helicoverpa zea TaxID=7113 RepID=UPI001F581D5C|nr:odorant receptor Or1-like [Helicoverpa zea]
MEEAMKYSTFQGFRPHFDALARVGYFKIVLKPLSPQKQFLHNIYRFLSWTFILTYNLQHVIRVVQVRHSTNLIVDTLFILLTTLNSLGKQVAFNLRTQRIDKLINIINGPVFEATKPYHVEVLKENALVMSKLLTLYHGAIFTCGTMWTVFPIVNRALGEEVQFTGYFPFETSSTITFSLALAYMIILITFQAYGNVTMDCTIVAFYAQAKIQIQMLRHNLEQLVEFDDSASINTQYNKRTDLYSTSYKDEQQERVAIQERLKKCVQHYYQILRFAKEVESIFGEAMVVQFFVMAWVICMTMYKIVGLSIYSAEFVSMAVYLGCMLAQLFIYCYFGTQLKVESELVNQSIYCCDWMKLSPRFRRQLLVMMQCCGRPIAPRTAYVIPMSLDTYIAVLRSSYTLFTFLNR